MNKNEYNTLSHKIIGAAIEVHKELGPGLLESVYEYCLKSELKRSGLEVKQQVRLEFPTIVDSKIRFSCSQFREFNFRSI